MIKALPSDFLSVVDNNDNLRRYLNSLLVGKPMTERSWLYEDIKNPDEILNNWLAILNRLQDGDAFEKEVFQFDTSQTEKWGPQGGVKPINELLEEIVMPTFQSDSPHSAFTDPVWKNSVNAVGVDFRTTYHIRSIRPATYQHVVDDMRARDTLESNSGWPDFARRNLPDVLKRAIQDAKNGQWEQYPAIALFRNYNQKTRLVWMFPMSANLVEGSFMQPLQSAIIKSKDQFFAPWVGFDAVRKLVTKVYDAGWFVYATDFSKTDEHFSWAATQQTLTALDYIVEQNCKQAMHSTLENMHKIPLIIGPDKMIIGTHGVSSGSNWTNFIESVFDKIFATYYFKCEALVQGLCAIGDDMSWFSPKFDDAFPGKAEARGKEVGQMLNAEKVSAKQDKVKFLQRLFQRGYRRPDGKELRGVYSTVRALKSSVYPERYHKPKLWSSDMFCARQYMILENCVDHPLFEEFVKFVVQGQKDLIPFSRKSRAELDRILRETKLLPGFNPTYNQEKRDVSLAEFASVRYAATL